MLYLKGKHQRKTYVGCNRASISKIINSNNIQLNANVNANEKTTIRFRTP